jgi:hypothetical protein
VIARGPFILFVFRLPLLRLLHHLLRQLLFAATPSSTVLVIPTEMFWLRSISRSADVSCTRTPIEHLYHACQLGRHVRLPSSSSHATHLVHYDLWTSPVLSISGYKYYLWWLTISLITLGLFLYAPSLRFPTTLHLFAWVSTQFGLTVKAV